MPSLTNRSPQTRFSSISATFLIAAAAVIGGSICLVQKQSASSNEAITGELGLMAAGMALSLVAAAKVARQRYQLSWLGRMLSILLFGFGLAGMFQQLLPALTQMSGVRQLMQYTPADVPLLLLLSLQITGAGLYLLNCVDKPRSWHAAGYCAVVLAGLMVLTLVGRFFGGAIAANGAGSDMSLAQASLFLLLALGMLETHEPRLRRLWKSERPAAGHVHRMLLSGIPIFMGLGLAAQWIFYRGHASQHMLMPLFLLLASCGVGWIFRLALFLLDSEQAAPGSEETDAGKTNALLAAVSNNIPDVIFVKDTAGKMVFANPATLSMLGKSADQVIGHTNDDIYDHPEDAQLVEHNDRMVIASGIAITFEETIHTPDGARTFYSTRAPWKNEKDEVLGIVGISADMTEYKRLHDALRAHETQLEELVAARTEEVRELIAHLESTREEEKRALARELHDDLGSSLTALSMHLAMLFQKMPADPRLAERAAQIKALLSSVAQTTRRIQAGLRPDKLDIFGIKAAIEDLVVEFENYSGVKCKLDLPDEDLSYSPHTEIALFRMVQEALHNIAKHAQASHANIVLDDTEERVLLSIRDDGNGFSVSEVMRTTHGLRSMRERAAYLGGDVVINSAPGSGTSISIRIPKPAAVESEQQGPGYGGILQQAS